MNDVEHDRAAPVFSDEEPIVHAPRRRSAAWALFLFLATCVSTFYAGMFTGLGPADVPTWDRLFRDGLSYAAPLMLILFCHEMGHYLTARLYGIRASYPFFIPFPFSPLGTMGAVIVQPGHMGDRRTMFDIAIAGPLAGFVVAVPIAWWGVQQAELAEFDPTVYSISYGDPPLLKWMIRQKYPELGPGQDVYLNPLLFAGWAGLFLTGFNLIPIGQLDGGHILYGLLGRGAHGVAYGALFIGIGFMAWTGNYSFMLLVILLLLMGIKHPPTQDDEQPLGLGRTLLGYGTMALFFLCFTLTPITQHVPQAPLPVVPMEAPAEDELMIRLTPESPRPAERLT